MITFFVAALFIGAAECAHSQLDSLQLPASTQAVVSKNQLLIPEKARKALERAQVDFLHGRYESAQERLRRALEIYPHCALAFTFQGILDLQRGKSFEASHAFQRAIEEDPSSGSAYIGMGIVYNTQGRFRDALAQFDRAAPFSQGSWLGYFEEAWAHLNIGEYDAAVAAILRAEKFAGTDPERLSGLAYLRGVARCQLRDYEAGNRYLQEAVRRDPDGAFAVLARKRLERPGAAALNPHESGKDAGSGPNVP